MPIRKLSIQLINQIAAGQVVEDPSSIVKELVENSIDANASKILVEISKGGKNRILVRDDGLGIEKDDLALAIAPHASSKIATQEDLEAISTLGFRGEALASIASVSKFTLSSKTKDATMAYQIKTDGVLEDAIISPVAHPNGTSIEVCELFFNVRMKRRFLKSDRTEFLHIQSLFTKIALSHPDIAFDFVADKKNIFSTPKCTDERSLLERASKLTKVDFKNKAFALDFSDPLLSCKGYIMPPPQEYEAQTDALYIFLNGRFIQDKLLIHAIKDAYTQVFKRNCVTCVLLYLTCNTRDVDVNIHPNKLQVHFVNSREVHDLLVTKIIALFNKINGNSLALDDPEYDTLKDLEVQNVTEVVTNNKEIDTEDLNENKNLILEDQYEDENLITEDSLSLANETMTKAQNLSDLIAKINETATKKADEILSKPSNPLASYTLNVANINELSSQEKTLVLSSLNDKSEVLSENPYAKFLVKDVEDETSHKSFDKETLNKTYKQSKEYVETLNKQINLRNEKEKAGNLILGATLSTVAKLELKAKDHISLCKTQYIAMPLPDVMFCLLDHTYYLVKCSAFYNYLKKQEIKYDFLKGNIEKIAPNLPFTIKFELAFIKELKSLVDYLSSWGFDLSITTFEVKINYYPSYFKGLNLASIIGDFFKICVEHKDKIANNDIDFILDYFAKAKSVVFNQEQLAKDLSLYLDKNLPLSKFSFVKEINIQDLAKELL